MFILCSQFLPKFICKLNTRHVVIGKNFEVRCLFILFCFFFWFVFCFCFGWLWSSGKSKNTLYLFFNFGRMRCYVIVSLFQDLNNYSHIDDLFSICVLNFFLFKYQYFIHQFYIYRKFECIIFVDLLVNTTSNFGLWQVCISAKSFEPSTGKMTITKSKNIIFYLKREYSWKKTRIFYVRFTHCIFRK